MAFLDNSGDIILDAVLTDAGRKRMAEGKFDITQFALGDDEIDYSLYNSQDLRGSAYYDIDILSTPVLEAFTDNASGLKSKLISIGNLDLLYLPVIKLETTKVESAKPNSSGSFYVAVNSATYNPLDSAGVKGILDGYNPDTDSSLSTNYILLHQGIDNEAKEGQTVEAYLAESQFLIEIDDRFGTIVPSPGAGTAFDSSYVDDDQKALYYITNNEANAVKQLVNREDSNCIAGPVGYSLQFTIKTQDRLRESDYLMQRLGAKVTIDAKEYYYVDTNVRVTGVQTGYRIDIPVRFLKLVGSW